MYRNALYDNRARKNFDVDNPAYGAAARQIPAAPQVPDRPSEHIYASVGKLQGKQTVEMLIEEETRKEKEKDLFELPNEEKGNKYIAPYAVSKKIDNRTVKNLNKKDDSNC